MRILFVLLTVGATYFAGDYLLEGPVTSSVAETSTAEPGEESTSEPEEDTGTEPNEAEKAEVEAMPYEPPSASDVVPDEPTSATATTPSVPPPMIAMSEEKADEIVKALNELVTLSKAQGKTLEANGKTLEAVAKSVEPLGGRLTEALDVLKRIETAKPAVTTSSTTTTRYRWENRRINGRCQKVLVQY